MYGESPIYSALSNCLSPEDKTALSGELREMSFAESVRVRPGITKKIVELLKLRDDTISLYAAKLIEHLQGSAMPAEDTGRKPMLKIFMKDESVEVPRYEKEGDSGLDLRSTEDVELGPLYRALIPTGVIIELPHGYEGQVRPRSGLAAKHGITVLNTPGTVDNGYRSEIKVILFNTSRETFRVEKGMRIAQLVIAPVATVAVFKVSSEEALTKTERGTGGFGSTGHN